MTRIIAIRPEPGLTSTINAAREMDLEVVGTPLFEIRPLDWEAPDPSRFDGLLIGSANAIRHGGVNLAQFLDKPVYAVGKKTESIARKAGFSIATVGAGGLQNVVDTITAPAKLLRIAGAEHVPLAASPGVDITTVVAYESVGLSLDAKLLGEGNDRTIILLHSAVAAEHFSSECIRLGVDLAKLEIAALGPRIAEAAGEGWGAIHVSGQPNDAALLEMVAGLCQ